MIEINGRLRGGGKIDRGDYIEVILVPSRPHERIHILKSLAIADPHIDDFAKAIHQAYKHGHPHTVFLGKSYLVSVVATLEGIGEITRITATRPPQRTSNASVTQLPPIERRSATIDANSQVPETNELETTETIFTPVHLSPIEMGCVFQACWTIQEMLEDLSDHQKTHFGSGRRAIGQSYLGCCERFFIIWHICRMAVSRNIPCPKKACCFASLIAGLLSLARFINSSKMGIQNTGQ